MGTVIGFSIGAAMGILIGQAIWYYLIDEAEDKQETVTVGIDPDELVAWLENYTANYEYLSPPTTGEITRKIREMKEANEHT